jgi:hypothetical protein
MLDENSPTQERSPRELYQAGLTFQAQLAGDLVTLQNTLQNTTLPNEQRMALSSEFYSKRAVHEALTQKLNELTTNYPYLLMPQGDISGDHLMVSSSSLSSSSSSSVNTPFAFFLEAGTLTFHPGVDTRKNQHTTHRGRRPGQH